MEEETETAIWLPTPEQLEAIADLIPTLPEEVQETIDIDWLNDQLET